MPKRRLYQREQSQQVALELRLLKRQVYNARRRYLRYLATWSYAAKVLAELHRPEPPWAKQQLQVIRTYYVQFVEIRKKLKFEAARAKADVSRLSVISDPALPRCACGCGEEIAIPLHEGRPRLFATDRCRKRVWRRRKAGVPITMPTQKTGGRYTLAQRQELRDSGVLRRRRRRSAR